jgi:hypothetical protein
MTQTVAIAPLGNRSYSAGGTVATALTATDIFTITGGDGVVTTPMRLRIGGIATAATSAAVSIIKRTTANTAGTATVITGVYRDAATTEPAKATVRTYTANPTVGTATAPSGGTIMPIIVPLGTASAPVSDTVIDLSVNGLQPLTLRSSADVLCVNLNGVTIAGSSISLTVEWMES